MNFDYQVLSDPNLSLDFIEENLENFSKADFNILCIFNKNITKYFIEKYNLYPWAYYDYQKQLLELRSQFSVDYDSIKKENKKKLRDKMEKFEKSSDSNDSKHKHIKK